MKKVLIVTYYWPPAGGPGVQRWLKFASYLPSHGIHPVVYTPKNAQYPIRDESLLTEIPKDITLLSQPIREPYAMANRLFGRKSKRLSSGIIKSKNSSVLERFLLWIRGNFYIPDGRKNWVKPSVKYLTEVIRSEGIETVITTGPPHSVHLIGLGLQESTGIRWFADFRDPWTTIGYHGDLRLGNRAKRKHKVLEKKVLNAADHIIVTSGSTQAEFQQKTQQSVSLITNGHDLEVPEVTLLDAQFTISHIGSLLSGRNPKNLWKALSECAAEIPGFREDLEIHLTGVVGDEILESLSANGLDSYCKHLPYVSHPKAVALQRRSQLLLLAEINSEHTRAIIPGKLFEYMASRRPILGIGPEGWEAADIIRKHALGAVFTHADQAELKTQLTRWYEEFKAGTLQPTQADIMAYSRKTLTAKLASLLQ